MKRRDFLKFASSVASVGAVPTGLSMNMLAQRAYAASPIYSNISVKEPAVMPQIINIFLYGGASELAGNLSNIENINMHSQNDYSVAFGDGILSTATDNLASNRRNGGQVTASGFWKEAGGTHMEDMLADEQMTVYRTLYKQKSPTRSHRESIFMSHKGSIDIENSPGIGSRLALMLKQHESIYRNVPTADGSSFGEIDKALLPFVSFEGESQTYAIDPDNPLPIELRGLTMDSSFNNPYSRGSKGASEDAIEALRISKELNNTDNATKYSKAFDGLDKREDLEGRMQKLSSLLSGTEANGYKSSAEALGLPLRYRYRDEDGDPNTDPTPTRVYPDTGFARQLEAAVTLAIHNPQTLYVAMGTSGLGGWDDHNNGIDRYPDRMNDVMEAIKIAMEHIEASDGAQIIGEGARTRTRTDNIVINVFGDFGRLVNLNASGGWDHANNQNLYTFGGAGVRPSKEASHLGEIVGTTHREGRSKTNNQYTVPDTDSLTWEPMSVASSIYTYFGATNSHVLTADATYNPDGDLPFEESLPIL